MSARVLIACPQGNVDGSHPLAHALTPRDAERVVYALSGAYLDAATDAGHGVDYTAEVEPCPVDVIGWAHEPELYAEHVAARTAQRRNAEPGEVDRP